MSEAAAYQWTPEQIAAYYAANPPPPVPPASIGEAGAPAPAAPATAPTLESVTAENTALKTENAALRSEVAALKVEIATLRTASVSGAPAPSQPSYAPPPPLQNFYPPPPQHAAYPGDPGYSYPPPPPAYPGYGHPTAAPTRSTHPVNEGNRRGPKGANLAIFCIPNSYFDSEMYEMCKAYGNVVFCSVACHRDTGLSRGYAFVSYETVAEAEMARSALHDCVVDGRALRVELTRADKEDGPGRGPRPY